MRELKSQSVVKSVVIFQAEKVKTRRKMVAERGGRSRRRAIGTLPSLMGVVPAFLLLFLLTRHVVGHETRR